MSETGQESDPPGADFGSPTPYQAHLAEQAADDGREPARGPALLDWRAR